MAEVSDTVDTTPLEPVWLSHHYACDADRCVRVGRLHVCRRCLAMFAGFIPAVIFFALVDFEPEVGDITLVTFMLAVAAYDFVEVVRGRMRYSPKRVLVVMPFVGIVLAWLCISGFHDGFTPLHLVLGGVALALLVILFLNATIVRRPSDR